MDIQPIIDSLLNIYHAVIDFYKDFAQSIKSFFIAIIQSLVNAYNAVIDFFKDVFKSIKSFIKALFETIQNIYDSILTYAGNVIESLAHFLIDLPLMVWKKVLDAVLWLFDWVSQSCSYCIGAASNAGSIAGEFQDVWATIGSHAGTLLYCLNRAGVQESLQILTCGLVVFAFLKIVSWIKAIL